MPIHSTALACDNGWVHHQHPMKPPGVIMSSTPCPLCQPEPINQCDGCTKGLPVNENGVHYNPLAAHEASVCTAILYQTP